MPPKMLIRKSKDTRLHPTSSRLFSWICAAFQVRDLHTLNTKLIAHEKSYFFSDFSYRKVFRTRMKCMFQNIGVQAVKVPTVRSKSRTSDAR